MGGLGRSGVLEARRAVREVLTPDLLKPGRTGSTPRPGRGSTSSPSGRRRAATPRSGILLVLEARLSLRVPTQEGWSPLTQRSQRDLSIYDVALNAATAVSDRWDVTKKTRFNHKTYLKTLADSLVARHGPMASVYALRYSSEDLMAFVNEKSNSKRKSVSTNLELFVEFRKQLAALSIGE